MELTNLEKYQQRVIVILTAELQDAKMNEKSSFLSIAIAFVSGVIAGVLLYA